MTSRHWSGGGVVSASTGPFTYPNPCDTWRYVSLRYVMHTAHKSFYSVMVIKCTIRTEIFYYQLFCIKLLDLNQVPFMRDPSISLFCPRLKIKTKLDYFNSQWGISCSKSISLIVYLNLKHVHSM